MSRKAEKTIIFVFLALFAVGGCSDSSRPAPAPTLTLAELPAAYAAAVCEAADTCLGPLLAIFVAGGDCEQRYRELVSNSVLPLFDAAIARGTLVYDPARAPACMDAIAAGGCDALGGGLLPAACEDALKGTVAVGGGCDVDAECLDDAACVHGAACLGSCTARGGPGRSCTRNDECERGLICDSTTCTAAPTEGQACQGPSAPDCRAGLICLGGSATRQGTCVTQASVFTAGDGATCSLETGPWCQEGLSCIIDSIGTPGSPTLLCAQRVASGAACTAGVPDQCPPAEYCTARPAMGVLDGSCAPLPVGGEPCATRLIGPSCATGHACVAGTCRPMQANGGACASVDECYSGLCTAGVCVAPAPCSP